MKDGQFSTLKKVLGYTKHHAVYLVLSIVFAIVTTLSALYIPIIIGQAIDCIIAAGNVDFKALLPLLIKGGIFTLIAGVFQLLMNYCNNKIIYQVIREVRVDAFDKIQELPISYIDSHPTGDIVSRIVADADAFADGLLMGFNQLFTGVITILGTLVFMLSLNWIITLFVVILTPISLIVANFIAKKSYKFFKKQSVKRGEETAFINEMIGNIITVKAYNHQDENQQDFDNINDELYDVSLKAIFFSSLVNPSTRFVNSLVYATVGLVGAIFAINGMITVGILSSFLAYATQYTKPFNDISSVITELQNSLACASRLFEIIEEKSKEPDNNSDKELSNVKGQFSFKEVKFSYVKGKPVIDNFNLELYAGHRVALVGETGCGKTTLINLVMRFYEIDSGKILLDGTNIKDVSMSSLRQNIGMVLQDTWLKTGTIRDNLTVAKPDATDDELLEACKKAHSYSFIKRLPKRLDTFIGGDGGGLSQGEKQLLCITRLMLNPPPVLILDEATSSIDTLTEVRIQKAFAKLMQGRTCFIVAHRLSTIKEADIILYMKDGRIMESGNHRELISKKGYYFNLYQSQFSSQEV